MVRILLTMKNLYQPHLVHLVEQTDAEAEAGGPSTLEELRRVWGLKTAHRAKGFLFFDVAEITAARSRKARSFPRR